MEFESDEVRRGSVGVNTEETIEEEEETRSDDTKGDADSGSDG